MCGWACAVATSYARGCIVLFFFFHAEDGRRDAREPRGLGDVYKRQVGRQQLEALDVEPLDGMSRLFLVGRTVLELSLIHI